jgi:hypothetical protein
MTNQSPGLKWNANLHDAMSNACVMLTVGEGHGPGVNAHGTPLCLSCDRLPVRLKLPIFVFTRHPGCCVIRVRRQLF